MLEMARPKVYLETTIPSYATALPSRDLVRAGLQQVTRDWWATRHAFDLYVSQLVLDEAAAGDPAAAARRLEVLQEATILGTTAEAIELSRELLLKGGLPAKALADAFHIAVAATHGLDFLLTWNCTHIANATTRSKIEWICRAAGFEPPVICTPVELVEEEAP
jgi:predicted nucleic acid-binding protein